MLTIIFGCCTDYILIPSRQVYIPNVIPADQDAQQSPDERGWPAQQRVKSPTEHQVRQIQRLLQPDLLPGTNTAKLLHPKQTVVLWM